MKKSNKIIILTGMILLLAVTAVFNFLLTQKASGQDTLNGSNYFTRYKSERLTKRNEMFLELETVISSEKADATMVADALAQKLALVENMEKELLLENFIKAHGFSDAVVAIGIDSKNINVFVSDSELTSTEAVQIYNILKTEAGAGPDNVVIIPIKSDSN